MTRCRACGEEVEGRGVRDGDYNLCSEACARRRSPREDEDAPVAPPAPLAPPRDDP